MKDVISIILLLAGLISVIRGQRCFDKNPHSYKWFTVGNIDYTITRRNARWENAERKCRTIVPGKSKVAKIESLFEWEGLRKVVPADWYWMHNTKLPFFTDPRYFHYDGTVTKMMDPRDSAASNCLVYAYPGLDDNRSRGPTKPGKTDFYCREIWAKVLCEVRC